MNEYMIKAGRYSATILDQGAILYSFAIDGKDIIVQFKNKNENLRKGIYFSQVVGPFANRIKDGRYTLDGTTFEAERNDGNNNLHSGSRNFGWQLWKLVSLSDSAVVLALHSCEGFGFPGNQDIEVEYKLREDGSLAIHYSITSDKKCPVNLTNHAFFNLGSSGDIRDHVLTLPSDHYIDVDSELIPREIMDTKGNDFDFTTPHRIGERRNGDYDHCFILDREGNISVSNGDLTLTVETDLPAVQLYTAANLEEKAKGKHGEGICAFGAFCLETEFYPDFPNRPEFKSCYLEPGKRYETETVFVLKEAK